MHVNETATCTSSVNGWVRTHRLNGLECVDADDEFDHKIFNDDEKQLQG